MLMIDITTSHAPQNVQVGFDWTSKMMVAIYAALATATLMVSGYFVIRGIRRRARLVNRPTAKATVDLEADATVAP